MKIKENLWTIAVFAFVAILVIFAMYGSFLNMQSSADAFHYLQSQGFAIEKKEMSDIDDCWNPKTKQYLRYPEFVSLAKAQGRQRIFLDATIKPYYLDFWFPSGSIFYVLFEPYYPPANSKEVNAEAANYTIGS